MSAKIQVINLYNKLLTSIVPTYEDGIICTD